MLAWQISQTVLKHDRLNSQNPSRNKVEMPPATLYGTTIFHMHSTNTCNTPENAEVVSKVAQR